MTEVKYPNVHVKLLGEDGNAFFIIARAMQAMRRAGLTTSQIDAYREEATSGDYNKVLMVTIQTVNCDDPDHWGEQLEEEPKEEF